MQATCPKAATRITRMAIITALCLCLSTALIAAQTAQLEIEGQPFVLDEFGAVIAEHDGIVEVQMMVLPEDQRAAAYRKVDLRKGDQIIMINGKRARTAADLEAAYNDLKTGDKITLAIKRDQARMMISFPKADPEKQGARVMIRTAPPGAENATPILSLGILVTETDGKIEIVDALPTPPGFPEQIKFNKGDIIAKLQGQPVTSVSDFEERYNAIETGEEVTIEKRNGGDVNEFSFVKPEAPQGRMMIKKQ